jgi:hypothetical protein
MKVTIQVKIESAAGAAPVVQEVARVERAAFGPATLGLTLTEAKSLLQEVQRLLVAQQAADYLEQHRACPDCGAPRARKDQKTLVVRSLFGTLRLPSPRLYACPCLPRARRSTTPLAEALPGRTTPELLYLEAKFAGLASYGLSAALLAEVLPLGRPLHATAVRRHAAAVAQRLEDELDPEQPMFIDGCQAVWDALPRPDPPLTVGLDGGYVHSAAQASRKDGWFEVIAGKSLPTEGPAKCFGFVQTYDTRPKRRLFEVLTSQGMQMNQQVTFLTDGGDDVRDLPLYLNPLAEHVLDWFHLTMRLTVMGQYAKSLPTADLGPGGLPPGGLPPGATSDLADYEDDEGEAGEDGEAEPDFVVTRPEAERQLERLKWYLWHGNVFRALQVLEDLEDDLIAAGAEQTKLAKALREFGGYVRANGAWIPNYGDRYRNGEAIASAFVESTVNQVVSKRMVKKQQMRWTPRGAHLLLQVRTRVLNDDLAGDFRRWYPAFTHPGDRQGVAA